MHVRAEYFVSLCVWLCSMHCASFANCKLKNRGSTAAEASAAMSERENNF